MRSNGFKNINNLDRKIVIKKYTKRKIKNRFLFIIIFLICIYFILPINFKIKCFQIFHLNTDRLISEKLKQDLRKDNLDYKNHNISKNNENKFSNEESSEYSSGEAYNSSNIRVHITGAVNKPGVYTIKDGLRIIDAVKIAGGFSDDAMSDYINLSKKLEDEMQIHIPSKNEIDSFSSFDDMPNNEGQLHDNHKKINIKTAKLEDLMNIKGIGKKRAEEIIKLRKKGQIKTLDDLVKVSGIGQKTLKKLANFIK